MKRLLLLAGFALSTAHTVAQAAPVQVGDLPLTVEGGPQLLSLTDKGIRAAFPSAAGRPDAVFLTTDQKVRVAFEWRDGKLAPNEVEKLVTQYPPIIKAQVPSLKTLKADLVQMGGKPWAQFVFTTPGRGDDLRRELLMTSVGGRVLVVTVASNTKDYSRNEAAVKALESSIRFSN